MSNAGSNIERLVDLVHDEATHLGTVLLVESDPVLRASIGNLLQRHSYGVIATTSAWEAVYHAETVQPDAIVIDLSSDDLDVWWAAGMIRRHRITQRIPLIALIAEQRHVHRTACAAAGFDSVLCKPVSPRKVLRAVDACLTPTPRSDTHVTAA